jgi:tRNA (mo5U34)-methyltransferase
MGASPLPQLFAPLKSGKQMIVPEPAADSSNTKSDSAALEQRVRQIPWFHSIDLGDGIVTPGHKPPDVHRLEFATIFDPVDICDRTVIDVGAWNGAYSFEAKRRGAARVLSTDSVVWRHVGGREGFDLARSTLGIDVEAEELDIPELTLERVGTFDVVLFLGVFYHLKNPIAALHQISALAGEVLILETHTDALEVRRPAMIMYPGGELDGDASNWWGPNPACMVALLKQCGFAKVDAAWTNVGYRAVYHAWRTDRLRRSGSAGERKLAVPHPALFWTRRLLGQTKRRLASAVRRGGVRRHER